MAKNPSQVAIEDFLRAEYGIRHVRTEYGGKHLRLVWHYGGQEYSHGVHYGSSRTTHRALMNQKAQLRRMMGGRPQRTLRTAEDQMQDVVIENVAPTAPHPEPVADAPNASGAPARTWPVTVAGYMATPDAPGAQVTFEFPAAIADAFPTFHIEQLDDEHWRIRAGGPREWRSPANRPGKVRTTLAGGGRPFSAVAVEAIEVDGEVLVTVPLANRHVPIPHAGKKPRPVAAPRPQPAAPAPGVRLGDQESSGLEFQMRAVLQVARDIEAVSPYHLTRLQTGALVWRAPTIE